MHFELIQKDTSGATAARAGVLHTGRGPVQTPIFMPVGTVATVKSVHPHELKKNIKAQIILANTYHLYLRPGMKVMEEAGGVHKFMSWDGPMLTDSGGYQVFSLAGNRKLTEEGALFQSHIDGSRHLFTPESVMDIQRTIGADICMVFDECPPYPSTYSYAKNSMELTHRWLQRCIKRFSETGPKYGVEQALFPIVQGSTYNDLRADSAKFIADQDMPGNAIGGLAVGEPAEKMYDMIELVNEILPATKPRYLMGVGTPVNILEAIARGVDMFDCVMPTRNGRHGLLFTRHGIVNIKNEKWKTDFSALEEDPVVHGGTVYTKGYLHHLFKADELLGLQIASLHNLAFYLWLVTQAREHIMNGTFAAWKNEMIPVLGKKL
ncbi:MAG: tRNA guanosine(34) transglycosylase Tgt [Bacteroidia bacterium]|nr:tRNA guanosine(34) transglycosylase Tgt [Bacteroidia bacterium]